MSSPTTPTATDCPALPRAEPLHPCAAFWFVPKNWRCPTEKAVHPFLLPHKGFGVQPWELPAAPRGRWDVTAGVSLHTRRGGEGQGGGSDNTEGGRDEPALPGSSPWLWAHGNEQHLPRGEGSNPGTASYSSKFCHLLVQTRA